VSGQIDVAPLNSSVRYYVEEGHRGYAFLEVFPFNQEERMSTTVTPNLTQAVEPILGLAFETGVEKWKIAFSTGLGQRPRHRVLPARDLQRLEEEIARSKARFGLPADARVVSCYEAGGDGFGLHRALVAMGVENLVVDSSSIEVNRRKRRAKTDRLDAGKLVGMLFRWLWGEKKTWSVVRVPSVE
jgi:transposase